MKATVKLAFALLIALALTFGLVGGAMAAPAADSISPVINKVVFVHGADQVAAKHAPPAKPAKPTKPLYSYSGIHWANDKIPVHYVVDDYGTQSFGDGLQASFDTWQADTESHIAFICDNPLWKGVPSSFDGKGYRNGVNEVGWVSLSDSYPNAIAVTMIWYGRDKQIVEVDTAMNSDIDWMQNVGITDPNNQPGDPGFFDVQDIMTHEAGHWLMLNDLYTKAASEQTMYGYGSEGELKARSLESGDIAGLRKVYPGATIP